MNKTLVFAGRNTKEILRDPLNIGFGVGFPVILLLLFHIIQVNLPEGAPNLFPIESIAPGCACFGLSFMTLFTATVVSKDRESSFLVRLYTTPLRTQHFIIGYILPMVIISLCQSLLTLFVAMCLGYKPTIGMLYALLTVVPNSLFFISLGLLFGSILSSKQAGGICGALITNLAAFLSDIWLKLDMLGKGFKTFAMCLPFANTYHLTESVLNMTYEGALTNFLVVLAYTVVTTILACVLFTRQMKKQ